MYMNFPDRSTLVGGLINSYLTNKNDFSDEGIHLLFTLNRWEAKSKMEKLLKEGISLIVDRYSYSGVAFSAAKGMFPKTYKHVTYDCIIFLIRCGIGVVQKPRKRIT